MVEKRKLCVVTGARSDYGLLYWLMKGIQAAEDLELQILVTGMHLSSEFGMTYREIEKDGFVINDKVAMSLSDDTAESVAESMGQGLLGCVKAYAKLKPDLIVVLGDRFEIFSAVSAAMVSKIPVAHLHGGEVTEGVVDEAIRHSITKMAHLHFTATEIYRKRVIQLGEQPDKVFNVGGAGIDNIKRLKLLSREKLEEVIDFKLGKRNLLVTFHPVTLESSAANKEQFAELLQALHELEETHLIFTAANADLGGRVINQMIADYVEANSASAIVFTSLGQLRYLSVMQYMDGVVGNSSSGLIEAPSFKVGTVNIGDRQHGRVKASSVIDCLPDKRSVSKALKKLYDEQFQDKLKTVVNPYGVGGVAEKVLGVIRSCSLRGILKKRFYDSLVQD